MDIASFRQSRLAQAQASLALVDTAIAQVLSGAQSYKINDGQVEQQVTRASLGQLKDLKRHYEQEVERLASELSTSTPTVLQPGW